MDKTVIPTPWPGRMPASRFRVMRPTANYEAVLAFYEQGVGLDRLGEFVDHDGYDGTMLGLPAETYHLEIIRTPDADANPCPNKDNGLVFYIDDPDALAEVVARIRAMGYSPVSARNPWWGNHGAVTFEDPDGWPVILSPSNS
ncbi:VOC family protein [Oceanibacterium hippocampi]|uniref:Glyoxalase-like domain protein n=1 Tax=Oceanibacterium hippocampi TaxID=745714 RepID=A0A1Y5TTN1_9PROT|nr:VOC family protein [Oceanibacterium hippocampi]SLN71349.1 Glyoxalase-like domain protein [Oceanibacterium hippocampi]